MNNIEQLLQVLHHDTAKYFTEQLARAREEGETLPPAFVNAMIKFLKDNDITCELVEGSAISDLTTEVTDEDIGFLRMVK